MRKTNLFIVLTASGALAACGGSDSGEEFYSGTASAALGAATNQADCATCHNTDGSTGLSGNTFKDIGYRTGFKGGGADLLGGINACVTGWMGGTALTTESEAYIGLVAYMQSISDPAVTEPNAIMPEVLADEAAYEAAYAGGDAAAGEAAYNTYCGSCHEAGLIVGPAGSPPKAGLATRSIGRIAQKVRTSGPPPSGMMDASDTTPGPMPFFEIKDLSETDLKNIIAHIKG